MASQVQREAVLVAGHVTEGRARVVVRTLWAERDAASHLGVGPDLAFEWLNLEDLVLEEHLVFVDGLLDGPVLASEGCDCLLLLANLALLELHIVIGVI